MAQGTAREYGGAPRHFSTPGCKEEEVLLFTKYLSGCLGPQHLSHHLLSHHFWCHQLRFCLVGAEAPKPISGMRASRPIYFPGLTFWHRRLQTCEASTSRASRPAATLELTSSPATSNACRCPFQSASVCCNAHLQPQKRREPK